MAKGQKISQEQLDVFIGRALKKVTGKVPGTRMDAETQTNRLVAESGGPDKDKMWTDAGTTKGGATGIAQMFPAAVADAHKLLFGETLTPDALAKTYKEVTDDPEKSILYSLAYHATLEKNLQGILKKLGITINDDTAIRTIVVAAYHLGFAAGGRGGGVTTLIEKAATPKPFSISKFVELFEAATASIGELDTAARKTAGVGGKPSVVNGAAQASARTEDMSPKTAQASDYIPLSFDVSSSTPNFPQKVIDAGTNNRAWSDKDPRDGGGLVGNPHLRQLESPAWFELRLNKNNGESLSDASGLPLKFKLNVSLISVNTKSQHVIHREQTATGHLITFWGSQPDSIVGRGTTGVFLNPTGLTSFMSTKGTYRDNDLENEIYRAFSDSPQLADKLLKESEVLRVAAQDAFMEFTALFKNNGVIRFLPPWYLASQSGGNSGPSAFGNQKVWSPTAGATGFQMLNRAGDTYTRGHVAFRYKGSTYLGYFKSLTFSADAKTPFKWDFDFNFRVLRSLSPVFKYRETANG